MTIERHKGRFDEKWEEGEGGCWVWTAGRSGSGYGTLRCNGSHQYAHRVAYELYVGEIPDGGLVLHKCDFRACVNPDHLYVGDESDNRQDMWDRDRRDADGEANPSAKLSGEDVAEIRGKYRSGEKSQRSLAQEFGVNQSTISRIVNDKTWVGCS